jgi:hypothetical protein
VVNVAAVSPIYSRTAVTVPPTGAAIVPFQVLPELLITVVISRPGDVLNRYSTGGPDTWAGATCLFSQSNRWTPIDKSWVRADDCRYSGVVKITRPDPTVFDVIKGADPVVASAVAEPRVTGL